MHWSRKLNNISCLTPGFGPGFLCALQARGTCPARAAPHFCPVRNGEKTRRGKFRFFPRTPIKTANQGACAPPIGCTPWGSRLQVLRDANDASLVCFYSLTASQKQNVRCTVVCRSVVRKCSGWTKGGRGPTPTLSVFSLGEAPFHIRAGNRPTTIG